MRHFLHEGLRENLQLGDLPLKTERIGPQTDEKEHQQLYWSYQFYTQFGDCILIVCGDRPADPRHLYHPMQELF